MPARLRPTWPAVAPAGPALPSMAQGGTYPTAPAHGPPCGLLDMTRPPASIRARAPRTLSRAVRAGPYGGVCTRSGRSCPLTILQQFSDWPSAIRHVTRARLQPCY